MACTWNSDISVLVKLTMLLLLKGLAGIASQMAETSLEMHHSGRIPCNHNFPDGSFDTAKWTKSTSDHYYVNGGEALVTWSHNAGVTSSDPASYDMIDSDLALVIRNVSLEDAGIYRCTVFPINLDYEISDSDNKLSVYKQPDDTPVLTYHTKGDEIIFNCSVGNVFPLNFPKFPYPYQNNHTVRNEDGTYVTSVSAAFQYDGSGIQVECSYSYRNQHWHSSLTKYGDDRDGHAMTTESGSQSSKYSAELCSTKGPIVNHHPVPMKGYSSILSLLILIFLLNLVIVCKSCARLRKRKNKKGPEAYGCVNRFQLHFSEMGYKMPVPTKQRNDALQEGIEMGYKMPVPTKQRNDALQEGIDSGRSSATSDGSRMSEATPHLICGMTESDAC